MNSILDILLRGMDMIERFRSASAVTDIQLIGFGILLVFGVINCILGYRLLRFWMMLFAFVIGAALGYGASFFMEVSDNTVRLAIGAGVGVVLAVLVFVSYKVGIFVLGAGLGLGIAVYVLHPTTSLMFFICLLAGAGLGTLAMKWAKEVIIVGTSLLGGAMAGMALAKIGGLADFPYGIGLSAAFAVLGMLIQFATNRSRYKEDEEEYEASASRGKKEHRREEEYDLYPDIEEEMYYEPPARRKRVQEDVFEKHTKGQPTVSEKRNERRNVSEKRDSSARRNYSENRSSSRKHTPVDIQVGEKDRKRRIVDEYGLDPDKTIVYRPRRTKDPEIDLPLDSYAYDDSCGRSSYSMNPGRKKTYTIRVDQPEQKNPQEFSDELDGYSNSWREREFYADLKEKDRYDYYDDPIDEDELDEEILREMMEEEDRESILPWKKITERKAGKDRRNGKRS